MIEWALQAGKLVHYTSVKAGQCGFTCYECRKPIYYKRCKARQSHFAHNADEVAARRGCKGGESVEHKMAKDLVCQRLSEFRFARLCCNPPCRSLIFEKRFDDSCRAIAEREIVIQIEGGAAKRRPDVTVLRGGQVVGIIEIFHTHAKSESDLVALQTLCAKDHLFEIRAADILNGMDLTLLDISQPQTTCTSCRVCLDCDRFITNSYTRCWSCNNLFVAHKADTARHVANLDVALKPLWDAFERGLLSWNFGCFMRLRMALCHVPDDADTNIRVLRNAKELASKMELRIHHATRLVLFFRRRYKRRLELVSGVGLLLMRERKALIERKAAVLIRFFRNRYARCLRFRRGILQFLTRERVLGKERDRLALARKQALDSLYGAITGDGPAVPLLISDDDHDQAKAWGALRSRGSSVLWFPQPGSDYRLLKRWMPENIASFIDEFWESLTPTTLPADHCDSIGRRLKRKVTDIKPKGSWSLKIKKTM